MQLIKDKGLMIGLQCQFPVYSGTELAVLCLSGPNSNLLAKSLGRCLLRLPLLALDELFYATPSRPERMNLMGTTSTGRYGVVYWTIDLVHTDITVLDFEGQEQSPRKLIENPQNRWSVIDNVGTILYLLTDKGAERSKIVSVDLAAPEPVLVDVVPQQGAIMTAASILGASLLYPISLMRSRRSGATPLKANPTDRLNCPASAR